MRKITLILPFFALLAVPFIMSQSGINIGLIIQDNTVPIVNIESPQNNGGSNTKNITILYNISDPGPVSNCYLFFNGALNFTSISVAKYSRLSFNISNLYIGRASCI